MPRIAVVGSGASALGVLIAASRSFPNGEVRLFEPGAAPAEPGIPNDAPLGRVDEYYGRLYHELRRRTGPRFPPPKTHFGSPGGRLPIADGARSLHVGHGLGGLTTLWGATLLPFTDRELRCWPVDATDLAPHYRSVARVVGVAATEDGLGEYFGESHATRPAIAAIPQLARAATRIHGSASIAGDYRIVAGLNRCAIETRAQRKDSCVYCGECMLGCYRGAVYSVHHSLRPLLEAGGIRLVRARVLRVGAGWLETERERMAFDRIFLCAGTLGSAEILMRSTGIARGPIVHDNGVVSFPVVDVRAERAGPGPERYLALCNVIIGCVPTGSDEFSQILVYPNFDFPWRYNASAQLWPWLRPLVAASRARLFWARLYAHSDESQSYELRLRHNRLHVATYRPPAQQPMLRRAFAAARDALRSRGFVVPPRFLRETTNSHYGATFPFGGRLLDVPASCEVLPRVYLCDASAFPNVPSIAPTFTIMANAHRIAVEALS